MTSPSYEDRVIAMFDSFNKRVSRNFLIDLQRAYDSRNKYYSNEPVEYLLDLVGRRDEYPAHTFEFYVGSKVCRVRDERYSRCSDPCRIGRGKSFYGASGSNFWARKLQKRWR